jgi:hypothetical protein
MHLNTMKHVLMLFAAIIGISALTNTTAFAQGSSGQDPEFVFNAHNLAAIGGATPVNLNDSLGTIRFMGFSGNRRSLSGATIRSIAKGTATQNQLGANLVFQTSSGPLGLRDRMIITETGLVGIGTMTPDYHLHIVGNTHTSGDFFGRIHMDYTTTDDAPLTYINETYFERKPRATLGVPAVAGAATTGGLMTLSPGDSYDHQLYFGSDAIYTRRADDAAGTWAGATWYKMLTGEDINGTVNYVSKFTAPNKLGDSQLFDNGTNVGIGTNTPTSKLQVNGTITANQDLKANGNATITGMTATGTLETGTTANIGTNLTVGNALTVTNSAAINGPLSANSGASVNGNLSVVGASSLRGSVAINSSGAPDFAAGYALSVNGKVITDEVRVALQADWPDYVFVQPTPDPLEWERYIAANQHLPGIPSAAEINAQGGYDLGETQRLLLEKVEQLSLMVIEQQKQINALQAELNAKK